MPILDAPKPGLDWTLSYRPSARAKRSFKTPLDAANLVDSSRTSNVRMTSTGEGVHITQTHPLKDGAIEEALDLDVRGGRMHAARLVRIVKNAADTEVRREEIDFRSGAIPLPDDAYPEVMTPFLLAHQPWRGDRVTLYTWINDRFVARVHAEAKRGHVTVGGRTRDAIAVQMYPDFNDWVPLGNLLTRLSKPFLPRYYMWFDPDTRQVLRFEGPYGPPGAPEIVLELTA